MVIWGVNSTLNLNKNSPSALWPTSNKKSIPGFPKQDQNKIIEGFTNIIPANLSMSCISKFTTDVCGNTLRTFNIQFMSATDHTSWSCCGKAVSAALEVHHFFSSNLLLLGLWPGFVDGSLHLVVTLCVDLLQHAHQALAGVCILLHSGFTVEKR